LLGLQISFTNVLLKFSYFEFNLALICLPSVQVITRTKENAEKKLTLTYEEMEAEREEVLSFPLISN
jgi:hypothetical protein